MAVLFDTNILLLVLDPSAPPPIDPATGVPLVDGAERIDYLVRTLSKARTDVLVPTPVLTEVLCKAGAAVPRYVQLLQKSPFRLAPFDTRAAIQCAEALAFHLNERGKGRPKKSAPPEGMPGARGKIKFDRQVVAIGQVNRVTAIYSDDEDVFKEARRIGIDVVRSHDLPVDPDKAQSKLFTHTQYPPETGSW